MASCERSNLRWSVSRTSLRIFSTTKFQGGLLTSSPYPSGGIGGFSHWRVLALLQQFENYDKMWFCENIRPPQIRLTFTKGIEQDRLVEGHRDIKLIDKSNNQYLQVQNGRWRTNDYDNKNTKYFVNFVVLDDFSLQYCTVGCSKNCFHCRWDAIPRNNNGPGFPLGRSELAARVREGWSARHTVDEIIRKYRF